jgi:Pyruvate/2-oxoacid:ferredoxin oxidoreductase delta subunit
LGRYLVSARKIRYFPYPFIHSTRPEKEDSMRNPVYQMLCERLNRFESKVPPVESFYQLLEEIYSDQEAAMAAAFPEGSFSADRLALELPMDSEKLSHLLEQMADKGQVFVVTDTEGNKAYELAPWMPGVIEFSIIRRMGTPKIKAILELSEKMGQEAKALTQPFMNDMEKLKAMIPEPHVRTIPVNQSLPDNRQVYPYEDLLDMIGKETSFAAMRCCCRHMANYRDDPCHVEGVPEYSCLGFGKVADYIVERNFGKRITREECVDIVSVCAEKGLVHNTNNFVEGMQFVCNCCGCCCGFIRQVKDVGNLNLISGSNFLSLVDENTCTGCGECELRCPLGAIRLDNGLACVDNALCIGCGNCVTVCPTQSIALTRISEKKPEIGERKIGLGF